ncbi:styrene monooxygenase/indole monooxygenase family protein [Tenacibaculum sp. UWU-22]|uniref:styrene monooxygenase/indole monooxygenase family protein n=1 Tax=Tenacibaculum sp. UWU-22 TaxID=3234187 RepID=UPI0034DB6E75
MKKILIIGAGQSGLQTGIGLVKAGFDVTIVTNRTAEEVEKGRISSSQYMFDMALQNERDLGIEFWGDDENLQGHSVGLAVANPENPSETAINWVGNLTSGKAIGLSIDQRVKFPRWMKEFEKLGGNLIIHDADVQYIDKLSADYDLTIVAAGKGDIVRMFERDDEKCMYDKPMRALGLTYVTGMKPNKNPGVRFNLIPTVGEYFVFPALTTTGYCEIMVFEGVPGGPMDCWGDVKTPEEHLAKSKWIVETFAPWEAHRIKDIQLTDDNGILAGRFPPTVRKPVATLPSGRKVLGIADVVVVNDPITGQGSNNASKCSKIYLDSIIANKDKEYDETWMQKTFDEYWKYAELVTLWTNTLLGPPPPYVLNVLGAAGQIPSLADTIADNFSDPTKFFPWWLDEEKANNLIKEKAQVS